MPRKATNDEAAAAAAHALHDAMRRTPMGREFLRTTDPGTRGALRALSAQDQQRIDRGDVVEL